MQTIYLRSIDALYTHAVMFMTSFIQNTAFSRKRLSEKVHPLFEGTLHVDKIHAYRREILAPVQQSR